MNKLEHNLFTESNCFFVLYASAAMHLQLPGRFVSVRVRVCVRTLVATGARARGATTLGRIRSAPLAALPPAAARHRLA